MDVSITIPTQNPPGTSLNFRGGTVPYGYLLEDGAIVSRVTYARLFEAIGTTYGAGDGSTTFKLPDSRGRADIGSGTGSSLTARTLGQSGGSETHTLTESEMPSHTHIQNSHNHTQNPHSHAFSWTVVSGGNPNHLETTMTARANYDDGSVRKNTGDTTATNNASTATNQNTGGGSAHNNMQPFLVATKMIKF